MRAAGSVDPASATPTVSMTAPSARRRASAPGEAPVTKVEIIARPSRSMDDMPAQILAPGTTGEESKWCYNGTMVSLSIKSVSINPRAGDSRGPQHRSLQVSCSILEEAANPRPFRAHELVARIQALGVSTPPDGTAIIRADRDRR
jgi:hypothetical protein